MECVSLKIVPDQVFLGEQRLLHVDEFDGNLAVRRMASDGSLGGLTQKVLEVPITSDSVG